MNKKVEIQDLGLKDYKETWDYQEKLFQEILEIKSQNRKNETNIKETPNYLLFVEHPHVYTLGKSGHMDNLLLNEDQLAEKGATFYKIGRASCRERV